MKQHQLLEHPLDELDTEDNQQYLPFLKSWLLTPRQLCDVELLLNDGFAPLCGFLSQQDYECVLDNMRLGSGALWPVPINLEVSTTFATQVVIGEEICLRN